jgi:putative tributyrin esterase
MALAQLSFFSNVLRMHVSANVLLPDQGSDKGPNIGKGPFHVLYLLHGLSDDHSIWLRRTRIEHYLRDKNLIVVMPQGFRGFYTNNSDGPAYADYIVKDIVGETERLFPAIRKREGRHIGGLSMGGYGALRIALGFPGMFESAHSHSGALLYPNRGAPRESSLFGTHEYPQIFGETSAIGTHHDLLHLAASYPKNKPLPRISIDCGTEDFLLDDNRKSAALFKKLKIKHTYKEHPGSHNWDYWDQHIQTALEFHLKSAGKSA